MLPGQHHPSSSRAAFRTAYLNPLSTSAQGSGVVVDGTCWTSPTCRSNLQCPTFFCIAYCMHMQPHVLLHLVSAGRYLHVFRLPLISEAKLTMCSFVTTDGSLDQNRGAFLKALGQFCQAGLPSSESFAVKGVGTGDALVHNADRAVVRYHSSLRNPADMQQ